MSREATLMKNFKRVASFTLASSMLLSSASFAAIPVVGATVIVEDNAYNIDYLNSNDAAIKDLIAELGDTTPEVFIKVSNDLILDLAGNPVDKANIKAVTYYDAQGNTTKYAAGDGDEIAAELTVESVTAVNNSTATVKLAAPYTGTVSAGDFTFDNGLTVTNAVLGTSKDTVTLTTSSQTEGTVYALSYKGTATGKSFTGVAPEIKNFEIVSAEARSNTEVTVVLADAPLTNLIPSDFTVSPGLNITSVTTNNNVVTLKTSPQTVGITYTITTTTGVGSATFTGKAAVEQAGAISDVEQLNLRQLKVSFNRAIDYDSAMDMETYYLLMVEELSGALSSNRLDKCFADNAVWRIVPGNVNEGGEAGTADDTVDSVIIESTQGNLFGENGIVFVADDGSAVSYNRNLTLEARGLIDANGNYISNSQGAFTVVDANAPKVVSVTNDAQVNAYELSDDLLAAYGPLATDKAYLEVKFNEPVKDNVDFNPHVPGAQVNTSFKIYIDGVEMGNPAQLATIVDPNGLGATVAQESTTEAHKTVLIDVTALTRGKHTIKIVGATDLNGNVMAPNPYQTTFTVSDEILNPPPPSEDVKAKVTGIKQIADNAFEISFDQENVEVANPAGNPAVVIEKAHYDGTNWVNIEADNVPAGDIDLLAVLDVDGKARIIYAPYKWTVIFDADSDVNGIGRVDEATESEFHYDGQKAVVRNVVVQNYVCADNVSKDPYYIGSIHRSSEIFEKDVTAPVVDLVDYDVDNGQLIVTFVDAQFDGDIAAGAGNIKVSRTVAGGTTTDEYFDVAGPAVTVDGKDLIIDLNISNDGNSSLVTAGGELFRSSVYTIAFPQGAVTDVEEDMNADGNADYIMVDVNQPNEMTKTDKSVVVPAEDEEPIPTAEGLVPQTTKGLIQSGADVVNETPTATNVFGDPTTTGTAAFMAQPENQNKILVVFDGEVLESSALNKNNYKFNGAALPAGSDVAFYTDNINTNGGIGAGNDDDNFVIITLPEGTVQKTGRYTIEVSGVTNKTGKVMLPVQDSVTLIDNTKPVAETVSVIGSKQVKVTFDELVDVVSPGDAVNNFVVTVNNVVLAVTAVTEDADGKSLILTLSQDFTVAGARVKVDTKKDANGNMHVQDLAQPANDMAVTTVRNY